MSHEPYNRPPGYGSRMPHRAVMKTRKDTSHGLHLVLTILTGGIWGLVAWLPLTIWHRIGPRRRYVTYYR